jgi:HTH-type transcriptional regulator/antitoxin HigA
MNRFKKIKSQEEYEEAIRMMENMGDQDDFENNHDIIDDFEVLGVLVDVYEKEHFRLNPGHPLEIIKLKMENMGLSQKDLVGLIGSRGVVSEVLNKKRGLSKNMIKQLSHLLNIDQEILNQPYELEENSTQNVKEEITPASFIYLKSEGDSIKEFKNRVMESGMLFNVHAEC